MRTRYDLGRRRVGEVDLVQLMDNESDVHVALAPSLGGQAIQMTFKGIEILQSPVTISADRTLLALRKTSPTDNDYLEKIKSSSGIPLLFPWPNRIKDAGFTFMGKTIRLRPSTREGYAIHGLVRDKSWKIEDSDVSNDCAQLSLSLCSADFPDMEEEFPYRFKITVNWILRDGGLEFKTTAINQSGDTMPMGFGVHTWFMVPFIATGRRRDCSIIVPASSYWELEEPGIGSGRNVPTGRVLPVEGTKWDLRSPKPLDFQLDDVLTDLRMENGWTNVKIYDPTADFTIVNSSDASFKHVCVFVRNCGAIAVEPYTCTTDAFNLESRGIKADIIVLEAGQEWSGTIKIVPHRGRI